MWLQQHQGTLVVVLMDPFLNQLSAHAPGKAAVLGPSTWRLELKGHMNETPTA